jgi:hypothetical protein
VVTYQNRVKIVNYWGNLKCRMMYRHLSKEMNETMWSILLWLHILFWWGSPEEKYH